MTLHRGLVLAAALLAALSALLLQQRRAVRDEMVVLREAGDSVIVAAGDARLQEAVDQVRLLLERARVNTTTGTEPHIAVSITDGQLALERGSIVLRTVPVHVDAPRGVRTIVSVGARSIVLSDSVSIYADASTPDSEPPRPHSVRLRPADFAAIAPNVRPGLSAFFF